MFPQNLTFSGQQDCRACSNTNIEALNGIVQQGENVQTRLTLRPNVISKATFTVH